MTSLPHDARAQTYPVWQGTGTNWNDASNWSLAYQYAQLQWTGGGNTTSWANFGSAQSQWRFYFSGGTAYTLGGDQINFSDYGGARGGILSDSTATQTIGNNLSFQDGGARPMFILSRNTGGLTFGGTIASGGSVTSLGIGGTSTSSTLTFNGAITAGAPIIVGTNAFDENDSNIGNTRAVFAGNNSYTGATTVRSGALTVSHSNALGNTSAGTTVNSGAVLRLSNNITFASEALTLNGDGISAAGALVNVNGNNTWQGTISNNSATRIGADSGTSLTISGAINSGTQNLYLGGAGNITVSGAINGTQSSGNGALWKDGTGTLTLTPNNSGLTGLVMLRGGTISITNADSLGTGTLVIGDGATSATLLVNSNTTRSANLSITNAASAAVINVATNAAFTLTGQLTQTGGTANTTKFGKDGAGTLIFAGSGSTYDGQMQIGRGTVVLGTSSAFGDNIDAVSARGIDLGLNIGDVATTNNVALLASNGVTISNSFFVAVNSNSATRTIGLSGSGTNTFNNEFYLAGDLTVSVGSAASDQVNLSGALVNTGGLIKSGSGNLILSGANTYTGTTTISAGTLSVGAGGTTGALGTGNVTNNATLIFNRTDAITVTNLISGSGAVQVTNAVLTLSGANTYAGTTTIRAGATVRLGNAAGLGATNGNTSIISGGALDLNGLSVAENISGTGTGVSSSGFIYNSSATAAALSGNVSLTGGGTVAVTNGAITLSGVVSDNAATPRLLTKTGSGTLFLYGANTHSGGLSLSAGAVVITNVAAVGSGTLAFGGGTLDVTNSTLTFSNAGSVSASSAITGSGSAAFTNNFTMGTTSATLTNNLGGGLTLSNLTVGNSGQATNRTLTLAGSGNTTINGAISSATTNFTSGLTLSGAGTTTLNGANTFNGGLSVTAGTLAIGNNDALGAGTVVFSSGVAIQTADSTARNVTNNISLRDLVVGGAGALTFSGTLTNVGTAFNITNNNTAGLTLGNIKLSSSATTRTLTLSGSGDTTISGVIANGDSASSGNVTINAAGTTVTFGGDNTYTGGTTITAGTLAVGAGGTAGRLGTGNVTNNSALLFNRSDAITISNVISGSGTLTKTNTNALTLSGANTYTNDTVISAGTLVLSGGSAIANTGAVTNTGGTLQVDSSETIGSLRGAGTTTLNGVGVTLTVSEAGTNTYAGAIDGAGGLTKTNSGRLILSGANTFSGATLVNAGSLVYNGTNTASAITVNSGGTLMGSGSVGAVTIDSGGTINPGNSPGTLSLGAATFAGGGNYNWQIYDAGGTAGATNGWDLISGSSLNITAAATNKFNINLWSLASVNPDTNGSAIFDNGSSYAWTIGTFSAGITNFDSSYFNINTSSTNGTGGFANSLGGGSFALAATNNNLVLSFTPTLVNNWTNAANNNWTLTSAWSAGLPTSSQDLFLTNGTQTTLNTNGVAKSLTIGGSSGTSTLLFSADRSLTVGGDITLASDAGGAALNFGNSNVTLTLNGGAGSIINGGGAGNASLAFQGGFSNSLGLLNASTDDLNMGQTGNGTLIITNGQTYNVANLLRLNNSSTNYNATVLMNGGTLNHSGSAGNQIRFNSGAGAGNTAYLILNSNAVVTATGIRRQNLGADAAIEWNDGTIGNYAGSNLTIDASAGTMNVKLAGTGTHIFDASSTNTITVASTAQLQDKSGEAGTLVKAGTGVLILSGSNSYTGGTTLSNGTIRVGNDSALSTGGLTLNAGTLASDSTNARTLANNVTVGGAVALGESATGTGALTFNGTVDLGSGNTVTVNRASTFANAVSGTGTLSVATNGSVVMTGSGSMTTGTAINLTTNATSFDISGVSGSGVTVGSVASAASSTVVLGSKALTLGGDNTSTTLAGTVTGATGGSLVKEGSGTLTLVVSNSHTGGTTLNAGALALSNNFALGTGALTINGGSVGSAGGTRTLANNLVLNTNLTVNAGGTFNVSGNIDLAGGTRVISQNGVNAQYSGVISNGGLTISNSGSGIDTYLSGANTYSGATTVQRGFLFLSGTGSLSNSAVNLTGGGSSTLSITNVTTSTEIGSLAGNANSKVDLGAKTLIVGRDNTSTTFAGTFTNMTNAARIIKAGTGELVISNSGAGGGYAQMQVGNGKVTLAAGSYSTSTDTGVRALDLGLDSGDAATTNNVAFYANGGVTMSNSVYIAPQSGGLGTRTLGTESTSGTATFNNEIYLGGDLTVSAAGGGAASFSGNLINSGNIIKVGAGTVILAGTNAAVGTVTVGAGTLAITNGSAIANGNAVAFSNVAGATLRVNQSETVGAISGGGATGGTIDLATSQTLTTSFDSASSAYAGTLAGAGGLTKTGSGTLTLSGANSGYAGQITLVNGVLLAGANNSLGTGTLQIDFGSGGTRALASSSSTSYTLSNSVNLFFNDLTIGQTSGGTGSLTIGGSGKTFFLGDDGGANTRTITVNGSHTIAAQVTGQNKLAVSGGGTLALTGANTFSGGSQLNNGTILVGNNAALGTGTLQFDFAGGTGTRTLASVDSSSYTLANNFNLFFNALTLGQTEGGTGSLTLGASTNTFNLGSDGSSTTRTITANGTQIIGAAVTGGANNNLNKAGNGTLVLAGDVSGLGGTITNAAGRLQIGNGSTTGTLGSKNVTVASDADLAFNRSDNLSYSGIVSGTGGNLTQLGGGTLTLGGNNSFTGALTVANGTVSVGAANNLGNGTVTISNGGKLYTSAGFSASRAVTVGTGGGTIEVNTGGFTNTGGLNGTGNLTKSGLGTLSLTDTAGTYAGNITLTNGTLQANTTLRGANISVGNASTANGSVLMGGGSVGTVTINTNGQISPGNSVGTLTVSNSLTFNGGGSYLWEITNTTAATPGVGWDLISVDTGTVGGGSLTIGSDGQFTVAGTAFNGFSFDTTANYTNNYFLIVRAASVSGSLGNLSFSSSGLGQAGNWSFSTGAEGLYLNYTAPNTGLVFTNNVAANQGDANLVTNNSAGAFATITDQGGVTSVTISNSAPLVFTNGANSYTGGTAIEQGTLVTIVNASNTGGAFGTNSGAISLGSTNGGNANAAALLIGASGVDVSKGIDVNAGGTGVRTIGATNSSGVATYSGNVVMSTNVTLSASNSSGTTLFSGTISGSGAITAAGSGTITLSGANSFTNNVGIVSGATLVASNNSALGAGGGTTTVSNGATLALAGNINEDEAVTIAGTGVGGNGALRNISGANSNSGTVTLSANATIKAESGTRLSLNNVDITGAANRSVTFDGAGTNLVTGSISTAGGSLTNRIIKSGSGELIISNNGTTGTGQLRLAEGTVVLAAGSLTTSTNTGTRAIDIGLSGDATGTNTAANAGFLARVATVSNSIYIAPSGGDGSYTRTIGTDNTSGTVTFNNQMYLGHNVHITSAGTANLTYSGNITNGGTHTVTKVGAGTLTLSGSNSWNGSLIVSNGAVIATGGNAITDANSVNLAASGAALNLGAGETIGSLAGVTGSTLSLGANALTLGGDNSSTVFAGVISGTTGGNMFKTGTGTFTLAGVNTYTGDTVVNVGTLAFSNGSVDNSVIRLGPDGSSGAATVLLSDSDGGTTVNSTFVVRPGGGTRSLVSSNSAGTNTYAGSIYLDGAASISQQAAGVFAVTGTEIDVKSQTLTLSSVTNGNIAVSSTILDSGANTGNIAKTGNGTVTLTGANAYAGTTLISGGTLQVGDGGATGQLGVGNVTNNASLVVNRTGAISIGNTISGSGSLVKTGAGTLTLGASNSFAGNVNITGGAISISDANRLGATNNTLTLDGGTLLSTASFDLGANRTLNIGLGGGTLYTDSGTQLTFNGTITNSSTNNTLTKLGAGTLAVGSGSGVYTGNSIVGQGVLLLTSSNALSQSFVTVSNGAVLTNNFTGSTIEIGDLQGSGTVNAGSNSLTVGSEGNNTTFSGEVNISGNNNFTAVGSGTLTLSGKVSDTQTGSTIVGAGAVQLSGTDNRLSTNAALAVSNGAVLDLNGLGQRVAGLSGAGTITNSPVGSGRLIVDVSSGANTYNGTMQGGVDFEKTGAGTMVLAGNNGFSGAVRVLGGTLSVGADNNFGNATNVVTLSNNTASVSFSSSFSSSRNFTVATGTTGTLLASSGVTTTLGGSLSKNGSVLVFGGGGSFIVNGVISGASANSDLVVSNSTVTLNATNTYSGPTYVHTGGTLNLGVNDAMPTDTTLYLGTNTTSGTVNLQGYNQTVASLQTQGTGGTNNVVALGGGTLTVNGSSSTTYDGLVSGLGSVVKSGTGTLALTAANTYGGATTISNGTLRVSLIADGGTASSIGTNSTVTMAGSNPTNAVLDYTGGNVSTDRTFVMDNGGGTINMATAATEMTLTGSASGTGKLIVGEGTLVLSNATANSFAPGSIQVDSGATLQLAANNQIGNSTGLILNGGTFRVGTASTGFSETLGTLTLSASSTIDLGAWSTGVRQLTFADSSAISWTGTLTITNWQGVALQSSDVAEILFGTGGLTSAQLGQVYWANQSITGGTLIGAGGELVPIPEPRVYAAAVALLAAVGWRERKRLRELLTKGLGKKVATPKA